jgi:hypothetical protein
MAADPDFVTRSIFAEPELLGVNHCRPFCGPECTADSAGAQVLDRMGEFEQTFERNYRSQNE